MRFWYFLLCVFILVNNPISAQEIRFKVLVINDVNARQINSAEVNVSNLTNGKKINITSIKKESSYSYSGQDKLKISVSALGFYQEDKILEAGGIRDGEEIEVRLSPKPSGNLNIIVQDNETKERIKCNVEINYFAKNYKESINENNLEINFVFDIKGKYKITTSADGYLQDVREIDLNISSNQNQFNLIIELVKSRMKQELYFFDKTTNLAVNEGEVKVSHKNTGQYVAGEKINNGKITFGANRNEEYAFEVTTNGFESLKENFKLTGVLQKFGLSPLSTIEIDIFDEETDKRIATELEIVSPSKKILKITSLSTASLKFIPREIGTYSIATKANGYINKSGTIIIKSISAGSSFYTLRLLKGSNEFNISVFDLKTKEPIDKALIKVFNNKSQEIAGKVSKNEKKVNLEGEKKYFFEVSANGYYDYTANIETEKNIPVFLKKKELEPEFTYNFTFIDSQSNLNISNIKMRILQDSISPIPVNYNSKNKYFFADKLNDNKNYLLEVSAPSYEGLNVAMDKSAKTQIIKLKPYGIQNIAFRTKDIYMNTFLKTETKVFLNRKDLNIPELKGVWTGTTVDNEKYELEVKSTGYPTVRQEFNNKMTKAGEYVLELYKTEYEVSFKFSENLNIEKLRSGIIGLTSGKNIIKTYTDNTESNFKGKIKPNENYKLEVEIEGYERFVTDIKLKKAEDGKIEYLINLKAKPNKPIEVIAEIQKKTPEPIIEKPKPIVETPKKETIVTPPKVEKISKPNPIVETVISVAPIIKSASIEIPDNFSGIKMNQPYKMTGIVFEKSKPAVTESSMALLNQLLRFMVGSPNLKITIIGHSDDEGNDQRLNMRLSLFRAKLISNYLFNGGINTDRINVLGKGSEEQLNKNDSEEDRAKNRRVEVEFYN